MQKMWERPYKIFSLFALLNAVEITFSFRKFLNFLSICYAEKSCFLLSTKHLKITITRKSFVISENVIYVSSINTLLILLFYFVNHYNITISLCRAIIYWVYNSVMVLPSKKYKTDYTENSYR